MTVAQQTITSARGLGVRLVVEGGKLVAYGQVTTDLREVIVSHRDEILDELARPTPPALPPLEPGGPFAIYLVYAGGEAVKVRP